MIEANQYSLREAAVGDCRSPWRQDLQAQAAGPAKLFGQAHDSVGEQIEQRSEGDRRVDDGQRRCRHPHETLDLAVGIEVAAQCGRRSEQHDDRALDHQRDWEGDAAEGAEVDGFVGEVADHRGEDRAFGAHQRPTCGER